MLERRTSACSREPHIVNAWRSAHAKESALRQQVIITHQLFQQRTIGVAHGRDGVRCEVSLRAEVLEQRFGLCAGCCWILPAIYEQVVALLRVLGPT